MSFFDNDTYNDVFGEIAKNMMEDPGSPTTYGLPDLLSIQGRENQEIAINEFLVKQILAIKKGKRTKIVMVPEMTRFIVDMFYGYKDSGILWKPRGSGGSVVVSIVIWLKAVYQEMSFYILAGSGDQSNHIYEYVCGFFQCFPALAKGILKQDPMTEKIVFKNGVQVRHITASQKSVIGEHVPGIAVDEASSDDPKFEDLIKRAIPIVEDSDPKCIMLCSTFHTPTGTFQDVWDGAEDRGYERYRYDIFDVMQTCVEDIECKACPLTDRETIIDAETKTEYIQYTGCNGRARTSTGFKDYRSIVKAKQRHKPTGIWDPEYECKRPGEGNKIYPESYIEKCLVPKINISKSKDFEISIGIDWGWSAMTAMVFILMQDQVAYLIDTIYTSQTSVEQIASIIDYELGKYGIDKNRVECWCDAENPFNNNELATLGFYVQAVPFGTYKSFAIQNVKRWMDARRLKFVKEYPISGTVFYKQITGYKKNPLNDKPVKKNDHFPDALAAGMLRFNYLESGLYDEVNDLSGENSQENTVTIM